LCLCVVAPLRAHAENSDVSALRRELHDLKQVVEHLNERVDGLERQLQPRSQPAPQAATPAAMPPAAAPPAAVPPAAVPPAAAPAAPAAPAPPAVQAAAAPATPGQSPRERWRQISRGMSRQEVEGLLGPPQRTMEVNLRTVWYYTYPEVGSGSVVFGPEGGGVDDWQTPPFRTWW
jgi:hypothetical protein